ncbi:MAG: hypothetical protein ACYC4L_19205 [Chloroflexota bacterium]
MNGRMKYLAGLGVALLILAISVATVAAAPGDPGTPGPRNGTAAGFGPMMGGGGFGGGMVNMPTAVAEATGATVADVVAEHQAGKSWAQIAEAKGVSKDQLVAKIVAQRQALLDERVAAGTLTAEQAKLAGERLQQQVAAMVDNAAGTGQGMMGARGAAGDCPVLQGQDPAQQGQNQNFGPANRGAGRGGMMRGAGQGLGVNR